MRGQAVLAVALAVILIAAFIGAILGKVSWLAFWILALALLLFTRYAQPRLGSRSVR